LQVLDEGRLTDGQGRTVDFRNTLIILTSNLGSDYIAHDEGVEISSITKDMVLDVVRKHFRPEFLNRLDEILVFRRLTRANMTLIVDVQLAHLRKLLAEHKIALDVAPAALEWLAEAGYDPVYGARPLKRVIQRHLQNPLAEDILSGKIADGQTVIVKAGKDGLTLAAKTAKAA
jgi:ATP-dependent Clp protease ATP-binding subunit ClpB